MGKLCGRRALSSQQAERSALNNKWEPERRAARTAMKKRPLLYPPRAARERTFSKRKIPFSSAARDGRVAQEQAELADDAVSERRNIAMAQTERAPPKRTAMAQTERAPPKRYLRDTT